MKIAIIVAAADNNVIGSDGDMPWKLSTDLKRFKALTLGKPMIMGRKTFESIGKPLPERTSIVVTRDRSWQADGAVTVESITSAIALASEIAKADGVNEVWFVGGGEIYRQAMGIAGTIHLTRVHTEPTGDTYFPEIDPKIWQEIHRENIPAGEKDSVDTSYVVYERRS